MKKAGILIILVLAFSIVNIIAAPQLTNTGFTSDDGSGPILMQGDSDGFFLINDGNAGTNYEIQFTTETGISDGPLKEQLFGLYLINSTVDNSDLKQYYVDRGVPDPYLTYLQDAVDGINPFAYINGSTLDLVDSAQNDLPPYHQIGMIIPGDYPTGIYTVKGQIENENNETSNVTLILIVGILIQNKTEINTTCSPYETENITLSADLIGGIDSVWFSYTINNTNYNKTGLAGLGDSYYYTIPFNELVGGMNVTWNIYADNTAGNVFKNGEKTFYIKKRTQLTVDPIGPDGENNWYVTEPEFTLTNDLTGNTYYQWGSTDSILYTGSFGLEDIPNPNSVSAGILELNWWTNFGICGDEPMQNQMFYVDLTDPLITDLQPENDSVVYNNLKPTISALLEEVYQSNSGIDNSSIIMKVDNNPVTPIITSSGDLDVIVSYTPTSNLSEDIHFVVINVTDKSGRNSELTWEFEIKTTPVFNMQVNSPKNIVYNSKRVLFNITTTEKVELLEYINYADKKPKWRRLCRECDGYKRIKTLKEGNNTIGIRSTDSFNQVAEKNISLFIDSRKPRISRTYPRRNRFTNGSNFYIKFNEDNVKELSITYNPTKILNIDNCTTSKGYKECYFDLDLTSYNGTWIEYYFKLIDIADNKYESKVIPVKVDTTPPKINNPIDMVDEIYKNYVYLSIDITEENLDKVEYFDLNEDPRRQKWKRLCTRLRYDECKKKIRFRGLSPNLKIRVLDKAGNSDEELIA